jgi:hypothetical protein
MATYRTKVRVIEAFRWVGQEESEWPLWANDPRYLVRSGTGLYAYTKNGPVRVNRGDWVICGDCETYPCSDADFRERYEEAPSSETSFAGPIEHVQV